MAGIWNILFSLGLIVAGLSLGYLYRNMCPHGIGQSQDEINRLRKGLQAAALLFVNPIAFGGAVWALNLNDIRIIALPFLGITAITIGGLLALLASRALRHTSKETGVMVVCGGFTNIGSIGSLVTFVLLGEQAVALMPFYKLFETFLYYGVGFPFAKAMSGAAPDTDSISKRIISVLSDKFVLVSISSILLGLGLNLMGYQRPAFYSTLNRLLIPLNTLLLLFSIGLAMRFGKMKAYTREALVIAGIKFIAVPATVYLLGSLLGLGSVDGGLPLRVAVVLASMPVAFTALVPPTLYDLDVDMANAAWFVSTVALVLVVPILWLAL